MVFILQKSNALIEDEKHNLLHCPLHDLHRQQLYGSVDELCPNFKANV